MKKILLGCISFLFMAAAFASSAPQEGVENNFNTTAVPCFEPTKSDN